MKYVLTLAVLLTLVACKAEESSSSKTCTLNGQPIQCTENRTTNAANDGSDAAGNGFTLTVSVTTKISVSNKQIEFLEETEDLAIDNRNGGEYECRAGTKAGQTISYKVDGNTARFFAEGEEDEGAFTRVSGDPKTIYGSWKIVENDEAGYTTTSLEISDTEIKITNNCVFTK